MTSLRIRLLVPLVVMFLPGLLLAGVAIRSDQEQRRDEAYDRADALADNARIIQAHALQAAEWLLDSLNESPELRRGPAACASLLYNIRTAERRYASLGVADAEGRVICASPMPGPDTSIADRGYFQRALETNSLAVGDFQVGRLSGIPTVAMARPTDLEPGGVLFASLDLNWLASLLAPLVDDSQASLLLLDSRGEPLVTTDGLRNPRSTELAEQALASRAANERTASANGERFIVALADARVAGWGTVGTVIAAIPERPIVDAAIHGLKVALAAVFSTMAVGLVGASLVNQRLLMVPLKRLHAAARQLQDEDLDVDLEPGHGGELGELETSLYEAAAEIKAARDVLANLALVDQLTGAATRQGLQVVADQSALENVPYQTYYLTLVGFHEIVATFGYDAADDLLRGVATRLSAIPDISVGRVAGNAFACIALGPARPSDGQTETARAIAECMRSPFRVRDFTISVSHVAGLALFPEHGQGFEMLLRRAEVAARSPRNDATCVVFDPLLHEPRVNNVSALTALQRAIAGGRLELHYQPVVDFATGRMDHVEALLRWPDGPAQVSSPAYFVPLAERAGMIQQLDRWVLTTAVQQIRSWLDSGSRVRIAVNMSARSLQATSLTNFVAELLQESQVPAELLTVEITETALVTFFDDALEVCRGLHDLGVSISVDDFGIGHSPVLYLRDFPVSEIKIDLSLTQAVATDASVSTIVRALSTMATGLGIRSVAEGVETEEQAALVRDLGCQTAQGYLFAPALTADMIPAWARG